MLFCTDLLYYRIKECAYAFLCVFVYDNAGVGSLTHSALLLFSVCISVVSEVLRELSVFVYIVTC